MSIDLSTLGTHFIVGLMDTSLLEKERELLQELRPIGIIIFKRNIEDSDSWQARLRELIDESKSLVQRDRFFVSIDHEGGRVHRLRAPITHFPPACKWKGETFYVAQSMGRELKELGFNLDFAPVLDVYSEEKNTVIGDRAFGSTPHEVVLRGKEFIAGLHSQGVLACGKHFPGHGGTVADSHFELPVRDCSLSQLRATDIAPFSELAASPLQLMMTAHVLYPALDRQWPATLSHCVLTDLLRGQMDFQGAVVSDALEMNALSGLSPSTIVLQAMKAGVDLNLVAEPKENSPLERAMDLAVRAKNRIDSGELDQAILNKARKRIDDVFNFLESLAPVEIDTP
jgi:beta-N-acetylhexosaminidase